MFQEEARSCIQKGSRNLKAHQLMVGKYSTKGPINDQADTSFTSSEASFCLQMQLKCMQAEKQCSDVQHPVTNLEYKLKPNRRRTKLLMPG